VRVAPGSLHLTVRLSPDRPPGAAVVITNPDEDCSPNAFRAMLDEVLAGPEPELESLDAADLLRGLRADAHE
jgi:hypothetical protein